MAHPVVADYKRPGSMLQESKKEEPIPGPFLLPSLKSTYPFHDLRYERRLSQREFAEKLGVSKSKLQRLEKKSWETLWVAEVELLTSKLGLSFKILQERFKNPEARALKRFQIRDASHKAEMDSGIELSSFLENSDSCFLGSLILGPQKGLSPHQALPGPGVHFFIIEGTVIVSLAGKDHLFCEGEGFSIGIAWPYEICNSHQFKKAVALIIGPPSLVQFVGSHLSFKNQDKVFGSESEPT